MPISVRGAFGEVLVGGRVAATFRSWTLGKTSETWDLVGEIVNSDDYWLSCPGPFQVRLAVGQRWWCLKADGMQVRGSEIELGGEGDVEVRS